jgi:hypothetical protein
MQSSRDLTKPIMGYMYLFDPLRASDASDLGMRSPLPTAVDPKLLNRPHSSIKPIYVLINGTAGVATTIAVSHCLRRVVSMEVAPR